MTGTPLANQAEKITREDKIRALAAQQLREVRKARESLLDFTRFTMPNFRVNWHHALIAEYLEKLVEGEITRLIIQAPPRHGKSELVSRRLPAYAFGRDPNEQIILASYSDTLAKKMNRDCQRVMDNPQYFKVFPNTLIPRKGLVSFDGRTYVRNSEEFEIMHHFGKYKCAGIGTGITGMGFTLGIIDDPFKDRKDADSKTIRQNCWDWFTSTFMTRAEEEIDDEDTVETVGKEARILITMTRWHEDDLVGRIIEQEKDEDGTEWTILNLPAVYDDTLPHLVDADERENGEALWPGKYNLKKLEKIKKNSSRDWSALFQGTPIVEGGNIVDRSWWQYYDEPPGKFTEVIQSWDFAFKKNETSDFVVGQVWGRIGADKYLLDQVRGRMGFTESLTAIQTMSAKWPQTYRKLVEDKANGPAIIETVKKKISGVLPVEPDGSKEARAHATSPQIESGNVYLPRNAPWVHDYVEEWAAFPNGKNDDQVDATTQALRQLGGSAIENLEKLLQL